MPITCKPMVPDMDITGFRMPGIDVSSWQKDIDFKKVAESGCRFVIIRAGYGKEISQKDAYFEQNYRRAREAGLYVGTYWYSYADSPENAAREAAVCLEAVAGKAFDFPVYFDLEEKSQFERGKEFCNSLVDAFCTAVREAGYVPGLYCSTNKLNEFLSPEVVGRYELWVAHWAEACTYRANPYGMWQYSSSGSVPGIEGRVDLDTAYVDYPRLLSHPAGRI